MDINQFTQIGLPVSLALIMLSLGLKIKLADFYTLVELPRATIVGLLAQFFLVPFVAIGVVILFDLPPLLAIGLMILSFCPSGVTSNWFSYLAKGNLPLSISLTVFASLVTPFTIPVFSEIALQYFMGENQQVRIPILKTMVKLVLIAVVPVAIGMLIRARCITISNNWYPYIYRIATTLFMIVIMGFIIQLWPKLPDIIFQGGAASAAMILLAISLGALVARIAKLPDIDRRTIAIEVGMQNGGMALVVTQGVLQNSTMSVIPVLYGLIMLIPIYLYSRWVSSTSW